MYFSFRISPSSRRNRPASTIVLGSGFGSEIIFEPSEAVKKFVFLSDSEKSALQVIAQNYGFKTAAIVSMADVMDALYTNGDKSIITEEIKAKLDEYYAQWGAK